MIKRLFLLLLLISSVSLAQVAGPKISSQSNMFDFGDVEEGKLVKHTYIIENTGDDVLTIERVKASCGCTAAKPERNSINPGELTEVEVTFNTTARMGKQRKHIYIFSNDKKSPQYRLSFTANVTEDPAKANEAKNAPKLKIAKTQHNFGKVREGEVVDTNIKIKNVGKGLLEIKNIKTTCGCTAALLSSKKLKPGETADLKIEFDTANRNGRVSRAVSIYSNDPSNPKQNITLFVNIMNEN